MSINVFLKWIKEKNNKNVKMEPFDHASFQDSPQNIQRLLKIFEKKYREKN